MKGKKSDDAIADRVAKLEEKRKILEFKRNLLLCMKKSKEMKERNDEVLTR